MIKRLRRRFITVNMCILSSVLFGILTAIFVLMYNSEVNISNEIMDSIAEQKKMDRNDESIGLENSYCNNENIVYPLSFQFYNNNDENPNYYWHDNNDNNEYPPYYPPFPDDDPSKRDDNPPKDDNHQFPEQPTEATNAPTESIQTEPAETNKNEITDAPAVITDKSKEPSPEITDIHHNDNRNDVEKNDIFPSESQTNKKTEKSTSSTTKISSEQNTATSLTVSESKKSGMNKPDMKEPDPFKGKVKRSYIYAEFKNIDDISSISYELCDNENDELVRKAIINIYNSKKERGKITIGEGKYRYLLQYEPPKMKYSIVFLDRTLEINTLNRLLFIFAIIAGSGLILIFFISVVLANWTIKPVDKAWNQQKQFIADASHELKTPLTVISTNTDVILSSPESMVKEQSKWLNYIKNETERMAKLVNNLLFIAKYDSNKIKMVYNTFNLSNTISSVCLQFEPLVFENNKTLLSDITDNLDIVGDEDKITQLMNILMDNALKYSTENGFIKVTLSKNKSSSVCLTVSNSSENIKQEQIEKIFDRFYRIDDSRNRKTGGSGLGLNIAKSIVESHKGHITAINKDNITSFIITFPV